METTLTVLSFIVGAISCIVCTQLFAAYQIRRYHPQPLDHAKVHLFYGILTMVLGLTLVGFAIYSIAV